MANLKEVRTRIASVSSTQQITSAMKMVSAAKFRRAQNAIIGMRPYVDQLRSILADIGAEDSASTPYHAQRPVERVLLVVITSNKGLCGAFNSNVIKQATARVEHYSKSAHVSLITFGRKATEAFSKRPGLVEESHDDLLDNCTFEQVVPLVESIMQRFVNKEFDRVELIYNQFKNSIQQILMTEQFLPVAADALKRPSAKALKRNDYIFEPEKEAILQTLVPLTLRSQFYSALLDSLAAEHGARMTAMQKATDNATELLKELKLTYNKARQAAITNEIIEIVSGSEALKN